jgi:hydrogenase maturation protease
MCKCSIQRGVWSMNASANGRTLIIGVGNPLRRDDGLGWVVADQLARNSDIDCDIHPVHQLTPELALWFAVADRVIIIDASYDGVPGELRVYPLALSRHTISRGTHASTPEELAALAECLYGRCAPITIVTVTGADFSLGEGFSSTIAQKVAYVSEAIQQIRGAL